jgi:hypothetical protein
LIFLGLKYRSVRKDKTLQNFSRVMHNITPEKFPEKMVRLKKISKIISNILPAI